MPAEAELPPEDRELVERDYPTFEDRVRAIIPHFFLKAWNTGAVDLIRLSWSADIVSILRSRTSGSSGRTR